MAPRANVGGAARMMQGLSAAAVAATLTAGAVTSASTISSLERDRDALTVGCRALCIAVCNTLSGSLR